QIYTVFCASYSRGRTRARASMDEEDSMDGTEITETIVKHPHVNLQNVCFSERLCAFCYCGGRSLLGQGELHAFSIPSRHDATSGGEQTVARENTLEHREQLNGPDCSEAEPERANRFWDELSHVGLPQDLNVQSLFESGQCWAHHSCALWSEGIRGSEGQSLLNVDRAIDSGSTKHCAYCKRLGASIKCCAEGCAQLYHYPCAGAAGTFQDIQSLSLLCSEHIDLAIEKYDVNCVLCDSPGDLQDQLFCTSCGLHYHGMCLDMVVTPLRRAGWQCPECKVCQTCKNPGEDTKMLVCDMCDKGYHTFCLQPAIDSIPTNGWRCKNCRVCIQCGTRASGQWHHTSLMCEMCAQNQDPALCCPLCACILDPERHKDVLSCHTCKRWLHLECERQNSGQTEIQPREDYICSNCRPPAAERVPRAEDMELGPELSPQPSPMHTDCETDPQLAPKHTDLQPCSHTPSQTHKHPPEELDPKPAQGAVSEEKDFKAIISTKETSTAPVPLMDQPMDISFPQASNADDLETVPKDTNRGKGESGFPTVNPSTCDSVENMDILPEIKPSLLLSSLTFGESSKSSVERLAEMVTGPSHSSPLARVISPRESSHLQNTFLHSAGRSLHATTLIPLTPKIGMGKPAITKRKFSPGRPRAKQVGLLEKCSSAFGPSQNSNTL
uniref:Lysine (K)-specific methyltransferase 2Cb n=1 Tax=Periophthalmus magnuspinnatus TaxID=409849 RepID=A0A3B4A4L7_9GOBI